MKKLLLAVGFGMLSLLSAPAFAQSVDFDIHIGNRPAPVPAPPFGPPPPIVLEAPPRMVFVEGIGSYVAVGVPYDLFFFNNAYYYHHNGAWYRSAYYRGPWVYTEPRRIPPGLYGHRIEELREYRRHAWEDHRERGVRFRERHFRAEEGGGERYGRTIR